jgi:hypothetical protein
MRIWWKSLQWNERQRERRELREERSQLRSKKGLQSEREWDLGEGSEEALGEGLGEGWLGGEREQAQDQKEEQ